MENEALNEIAHDSAVEIVQSGGIILIQPSANGGPENAWVEVKWPEEKEGKRGVEFQIEIGPFTDLALALSEAHRFYVKRHTVMKMNGGDRHGAH